MVRLLLFSAWHGGLAMGGQRGEVVERGRARDLFYVGRLLQRGAQLAEVEGGE